MNRVVVKDKVYNKTTIYPFATNVSREDDDLIVEYLDQDNTPKRIVYQRSDIFSFEIGPVKDVDEEDENESVNP